MISHGIKTGGTEALEAKRTQLVNKQLWENIAKVLGVGAGVGLVGRGAQGLYNMGRRALTTPETTGPKTISVPSPVDEDKRAEEEAGFWGGSEASHWTGHPFAMPAAAAAATGGALGGWKLMDYVLDDQRKKQMEGELESAKRQYEKALLSQYDKNASELGRDLDGLFDLLNEKQATWGDAAGRTSGGVMAAGGGLALVSGLITHSIVRKRRQKALLDQAVRKRRREQAQLNPTRIFAVPSPSPTSGNAKPLDG